MASFTDSVPQFNTYIQQQPVEAMATVGMQREEQRKAGLEKVQSYYDNLLSLPIAKTETQNYVKMKVDELNSSVQQSVQGDFSDQRLINSIGSLAGKIGSDPIIQNGVRSTSAIQSGMAAIEQSKKDKNYAPQNEQYFMSKVNQWTQDGDLQNSFNDQYTPYKDYLGEFTKMYKEAHPSENVDRDSFMIDKNGNIQVDPVLKSGIDANKVASVWNLVSSQPDVQQQLNIDGWSRYKGQTASSLWQSHKAQTNAFIGQTEKAIQDLQQKIATDKTVNVAQATQQINAYKEQIQRQKDGFESISSLLQKNPEAAKASLLENQVLSSLVGAYSYEEMKKSPLWETNMESLKYDLDLTKNQLEQEKFKYQQVHDREVISSELQRALIAHSGKKKGTDENGNEIGLPDVVSAVQNVSESAGTGIGIDSFNQMRKDKTEQLNQGTYGVVFDMYNNRGKAEAGDFNPIKQDPATGGFRFNVDVTGTSGYKTMEEAHQKYRDTYMNGRESIASGKANASTMRSYQAIDPLVRDVRNLNNANDELSTKKDVLMNSMKSRLGDNFNPDFVDAYAVFNKQGDYNSALARLRQKYGADWQAGMGLQNPTVPGAYNATTIAGPNQGKYNEFDKKFSKDLVPQFQSLVNDYKAKQQQLYPVQSAFAASKDSEKEPIRALYANIANAVNSRGGGSIGAFKDFAELVSGDSKEKFKNNIYGARWDPLNKKYYLTAQRDATEAPKEIEVSQAEFDAIPGLRSTNAFDAVFGSTMNISGGVTTDVPYKGTTGGIATAFVQKRPYDSKYDVRYHVIRNSQGQYDLKLYIKDGKTGNDIASGVMAGFSASKAGVMDALEKMKNDTIIEGFLPADVLVRMKQNAGQQ